MKINLSSFVLSVLLPLICSGCAVVSVADAAVSVASAGVSVAADVVSTGVHVTSSVVKAVVR